MLSAVLSLTETNSPRNDRAGEVVTANHGHAGRNAAARQLAFISAPHGPIAADPSMPAFSLSAVIDCQPARKMVTNHTSSSERGGFRFFFVDFFLVSFVGFAGFWCSMRFSSSSVWSK